MKSKTPKPAKIKTPRRKKSLKPEVLPALRSADADSDQDHSLDEDDLEPEITEDVEGTSEDPHEKLDQLEYLPASNEQLPQRYEGRTSDPLQQYFNELKKYPLLEPHEELAYAQQLREKGDINAAKILVSANLRLVVKIAHEYRSVYANLMDLIQEGNIGLMKAVSRFDPTRGARLGYYASWWIRSYILKYLLDNFRLVKIGTTQAQKKLFYHLMREQQRLEAQGFLAAPKLLAEKLDVREKDIVEMQHRLSGHGAEVSIDTPLNSDDGAKKSYLEFFEDPAEPVEDRLGRQQMLKKLRERLPEFEKTLGKKEKKVLNERLLSDEPKTLQEVADQYGLTRERVRQIEAQVIDKLRTYLKQTEQF